MAEESVAREMSQLCQQSMILAVICSPLKHWNPVFSCSSHLLQLPLSSYISHHLTNANSEPGAFVFFVWRMSYLAFFGAKILAICLLKLLLISENTWNMCHFTCFILIARRGWKKHFLLGARYAPWPLAGWHLRCSISYKRKCSYAFANSGVKVLLCYFLFPFRKLRLLD